MFRRAVDLFTPDEHAILADWFRTKPRGCAQDIPPQDAAKRLGFTKEPFHYLLNDAVVAYIVLEQVERQLPGWSAITDDGEFVTERHFRDVSASRIGRLQYCPRAISPPSTGPTAGRVIAGRWRITSLGFPTMIASS